MKNRLLGAGLGAAAALAFVAPAHAQSVDTYYFHCAGGDAFKVQNLTAIAPGQAFWDTTKPTRSFTTGAGCGFGDAPLSGTNPVNIYDAYFSGTHEKAVAKASVELHNLVTSRVREGTTNTFTVKLTSGSGTDWTLLATKTFEVTPQVSSTGATEKMVVEFSKLNVKPEAGRQINVTVDAGIAPPQAWVFDAAEIPASVTFTEPVPVA